MKLKFLTALSITAFTITSHAAITYVDAVFNTGGNTFATGGSLGTTTWVDNANTNTDNNTKWQRRTGFSNGNDFFQARVSTTGTIPELTTQISGLPAGTYNVWVFFWDAGDANKWNISAGLTSGASNLTTYSFDGAGNTTAPVAASTLDFSTTVVKTEEDRVMYGVNLGQKAVVSGNAINVYVDHLTGVGGNFRTWYDGVGYEAVPEPSAMVLGLIGTLTLLRRRRQA